MAQLILSATGVYLGIGLLVAIAFVWRGVKRVDPGANGASPWFFVLIVPGVAALWPVMLGRWLRAGRGS